MNTKKRRLNVSIIIGLLVLLLILPAMVLAQDDEPLDPEFCNPFMERLAEEMGVDCAKILELRAEGFGLGEIMKAWYLSKELTGFGEDWEDLLRSKQDGQIGWGQFKMAQRMAGDEGDPVALLALKQSGIGWGHIKKAQALDEAGIMKFGVAIEMSEQDLDWDKIQEELGLPPGPPPWAGGGKDKSDQGPPPWSNAGGKDKDKGEQGPPSWANNEKPQEDGGE